MVHDVRHAAPACAGRVHRDVYGAGVGRAISTGHVKSSGQWCEMLRATRSARASVLDAGRAEPLDGQEFVVRTGEGILV